MMKNDEFEILDHLIKDMEDYPERIDVSREEMEQLLTEYDAVNQKERIFADDF